MKHLLLLACVLSFPGCLVETLTTTAIQGELASQNAQSATRALDAAKTATARTEVTHAIGVYQAEHGEYPPSLEALVPEYLPHVPTRADGSPYAYNPATGQLTGGPAPAPASDVPFTSDDRANMKELEQAIYDYWASTGRYPKSLDVLKPLYIDRIPRLSSGAKFIYEPETGAVYHPSELGGSSANSQPQPGQYYRQPGGAGPAANVVTGIGIQNQLNSMGPSSSGTGSAARRSVNSINSDYSDRQMKALGYVDQ